MPVYMIAEMDVTDPAQYEKYKAAAAELIERFGGRYLSRGGQAISLEGPPPKRVVMAEFETMDAAQRWYRSPEYQAVKALRDNAATGRLFVVEHFEQTP